MSLRWYEIFGGSVGDYDLEIYDDQYSGAATRIRVPAIELEYDQSDSPVEKALKPLTCFATLHSDIDGQFDDFITATDQQFRIVVKRNNIEIFNGFYIPDNNESDYDRVEGNLEIRAGCGLYILKYLEYEPISENEGVPLFDILKNILDRANTQVSDRGLYENLSLRTQGMGVTEPKSILAKDGDEVFQDENVMRSGDVEGDFDTFADYLVSLLQGLVFCRIYQSNINGELKWTISRYHDQQHTPTATLYRDINNIGSILGTFTKNHEKHYGVDLPEGYRPVRQTGLKSIVEPIKKLILSYVSKFNQYWWLRPENPAFTNADLSAQTVSNWQYGSHTDWEVVDVRGFQLHRGHPFLSIYPVSQQRHDEVLEDNSELPPFRRLHGMRIRYDDSGTLIGLPSNAVSSQPAFPLNKSAIDHFGFIQFNIGIDYQVGIRRDHTTLCGVEIRAIDLDNNVTYYLYESDEDVYSWDSSRQRLVFVNLNFPQHEGLNNRIINAPLDFDTDVVGDIEIRIILHQIGLAPAGDLPAWKSQAQPLNIFQSLTYHWAWARLTDPESENFAEVSVSKSIDRNIFVGEKVVDTNVTDYSNIHHVGSLSSSKDITRLNDLQNWFLRYNNDSYSRLIDLQAQTLIDHYFSIVTKYSADMYVGDQLDFGDILKINGVNHLLIHARYNLLTEQAQTEWVKISDAEIDVIDDGQTEDPIIPFDPRRPPENQDSMMEGQDSKEFPHGDRGNVYKTKREYITDTKILETDTRIAYVDATTGDVDAILPEHGDGHIFEIKRIDSVAENKVFVLTQYDSLIEGEEERQLAPGDSIKVVAALEDGERDWHVIGGTFPDREQVLEALESGEVAGEVSLASLTHPSMQKLIIQPQVSENDIDTLVDTTDCRSLIIRAAAGFTITIRSVDGNFVHGSQGSSNITLNGDNHDFAEYVVTGGIAFLKIHNTE